MLKNILTKLKLLQVVERLCNLKPIETRADGTAEFELEMALKDPSSKVFLFKVRYFTFHMFYFPTLTN